MIGRVSTEGWAVAGLTDAWSTDIGGLRQALLAPFDFARRVLGIDPLLVERQPLRPREGSRSFASGRGDAPLHTDSQMLLGIPPALQILVCLRPADRGGETLLLDAQGLLDRVPDALQRDLFSVARAQRFYFGTVHGPTIALRGEHLAWTVAPLSNAATEDHVAPALASAIAREPLLTLALRAGQALVASNHRMLHGRLAFEGERELVRLLVWLDEPLPADPRQRSRATAIAPALPREAVRRWRAVLAILRGEPPAKVAADASVSEEALYAWRDAFVRGGLEALTRYDP